jgi:hypothetical protein
MKRKQMICAIHLLTKEHNEDDGEVVPGLHGTGQDAG